MASKKTFLLGLGFFIFLALYVFSIRGAQASSYTYDGYTNGFVSGSKPDPIWWVQVQVDIKDAYTGSLIGGTFSVNCKSDGFGNSSDDVGLNVFWEGVWGGWHDSVHNPERYGPYCSSGSASSGGAVFMGSCPLP
ncbi:hypothetical protein COU89_01585, partial [Candidatus Roizmanbacteria bacterium CG10_big_fil_rev_8_21_14_0_10_45_7]